MSTRFDRRRVAALSRTACCLFVFLGVAACDPAPGGSGATTAASPTAAASATASSAPPAAEPAPPPPADLDVAELQKALGCGGTAKSGACGVLAGFASCKPWSAQPPSGDGRWIGRGVEIDGKKTAEQVTVLRVRRVTTSEVGAGQLPARVGLGVIEKDEGTAFTEADRAIRQLERSDVPNKGNAAIEHLKQMTQWSEAFVTRTTGGHVYGISQGGLFVCEGPKHELLVVRRASTRSGAGDGLYATLWPATW